MIQVAKNAGFCFGVERAVSEVERLIEVSDEHTHIYTLGMLIHNRIFMQELEDKHVKICFPNEIPEILRLLPKQDRVFAVVRAHGIPLQDFQKLSDISKEDSRFTLIDCTCPYVKRIHKIVSEHTSGDAILIIIGDEQHPEVLGIKSYSKAPVYIFGNAEELEKSISGNSFSGFATKKVVAVAQTTQNLKEWRECQKKIKKHCTNSLIFDTICSVTENRQNEVDLMSKQMDMMLVIGGKDSSNTKKLYQISKNNNPNTHLLENTNQIPFGSVTPYLNIGIAAGASTPHSIIEEVKNRMSEIMNSNAEVNFAEMLENSLKSLNTGDTVTGTVTAVSQTEVYLDLGAKATGIIAGEEFLNESSEKLSDVVHVGDEITGFVIRVSDVDGVAMLSKKRIDSMKNWLQIVNASKEGTILQAKITQITKGGVVAEALSNRVFIPASQTGISKNGDLSVLSGTVQRIKIIDLDEQKKRAVGSIKVILREEQKALAEKFWNEVEEGKTYRGVVKTLTSFGAFVDLGGADGLVHNTELSWKMVKHPSEVVNVGDEIEVFVLKFDKETKKISLGYKTEATNPWNIFKGQYAEGDIASVKIMNIMPFGAFAEIVPGVDGLIHISQICDRKINSPAEVLNVGESVDVKIIKIDEENHKVSLSISALLESDASEEDVEVQSETDEVVSENTDAQ